MNTKEYYDWVSTELKANDNGTEDADLLNYTSGMTEEASEVMKIINKNILHSDIINNEVEKDKFLEETGDYLWYLTAFHAVKFGNGNSFTTFIWQYNVTFPHMEINAMMCDSAKLQGLYRKIVFLDKDVKESDIEEVYKRCVRRFFELITYFGFSLYDVMEYNKKKLDIRYPNGRSSKFYIELVKREK